MKRFFVVLLAVVWLAGCYDDDKLADGYKRCALMCETVGACIGADAFDRDGCDFFCSSALVYDRHKIECLIDSARKHCTNSLDDITRYCGEDDALRPQQPPAL